MTIVCFDMPMAIAVWLAILMAGGWPGPIGVGGAQWPSREGSVRKRRNGLPVLGDGAGRLIARTASTSQCLQLRSHKGATT
jgi:hypothetical protein